MSLAAEKVFYYAVAAAEATRQQSKAAALITYAYAPANAVAYATALSDADVAYITTVNAARDTSNLMLGTVGDSGPLPFSGWATIVS